MSAFNDLAILIGLSAVFGLLAYRLKQPLILGYIAAGIVLHSTGLLTATSEGQLELFSKIGIVFLLFILGLDLDIRELKHLGTVALATGIGQIVFTTIFGIIIATLLGFSFIASVYLAIALTFSSTIVVVKLLSQKRELDALHGKISVGFLLVQDFVAIILLVLLSASNKQSGLTIELEVMVLILKALILGVVVIFFTEFIIPRLIKLTGYDREMLFIAIIAWALIFSAVSATPLVGFSIEIGALLAGIALSARKEHLQIESWTKPLRDFFLVNFFVLLGFKIQIGDISEILLPAIIFSTFVLIGNPLIVMCIMGILGFRSKVSFKAGLTVAQISEFSLLVGSVGIANGALRNADIALLTIVGGITMSLSSFMIYYDEIIYDRIKHLLVIFERKHLNNQKTRRSSKSKIILFGYKRLALELSGMIADEPRRFIIVDNDPGSIKQAEMTKAEAIYGDLADSDLLKTLNLEKAELVISTVPDRNANLTLLTYLSINKIKVPTIVTAFDDTTAAEMYNNGADLVIYPYLSASQQLASVIDSIDETDKLGRIAAKHQKILRKRLEIAV